MTMTRDDLDRLKTVCGDGSDTQWILASGGKICDSCESGIGEFDHERDAKCAVEAFNAVPALIAEVERLRVALDAHAAEMERLAAERDEATAMLDWVEFNGIKITLRGNLDPIGCDCAAIKAAMEVV